MVAKKIDKIFDALQLPGVNSISIDKNLGCVDHSLNLVVNAELNSVANIKSSVDSFKKLVTGCHKSNLYCERNKKACTDRPGKIKIRFNKFIV